MLFIHRDNLLELSALTAIGWELSVSLTDIFLRFSRTSVNFCKPVLPKHTGNPWHLMKCLSAKKMLDALVSGFQRRGTPGNYKRNELTIVSIKNCLRNTEA
jgi:hypothetical protein